MSQLKSIYNSPLKDLHSYPFHTCFPIIASKWIREILGSYLLLFRLPQHGPKFSRLHTISLGIRSIWTHIRSSDFFGSFFRIIVYSLSINLTCEVLIWVILLANEQCLEFQSATVTIKCFFFTNHIYQLLEGQCVALDLHVWWNMDLFLVPKIANRFPQTHTILQ